MKDEIRSHPRRRRGCQSIQALSDGKSYDGCKVVLMPKRASPIVPAAARERKSKKKSPKASEDAPGESEEDAAEPTPEELTPTVDADLEAASLTGPGHEGLLSLEYEPEAETISGRKLAASADGPDKPERFFSWLIAPLPAERFWAELHERRPFHVSRPQARTYFDGFFGRKDIDALLRAGKLKYTEELDITRYEDGTRSTLNGEGVAQAADVWGQFARGCSLRLSWPQRHSAGVWSMVALVEEYFGCGGGCNAYLTPAGTQGFAPHFDDVDAFVVQVEGVKEWRLYAPRSVEEALPRFSSPNFEQKEVGELVATVTLHPGDLLYLPRCMCMCMCMCVCASAPLTSAPTPNAYTPNAYPNSQRVHPPGHQYRG